MRAINGFIGNVRRARVACVLLGVSLFGAGVSAQDIGGVIALPDAPFVIPVPDRTYTFPDYRSNDVLTQRNDNNRSGASYVRGLNQETVRGFRKLGEFLVNDVKTKDKIVKDEIWAQPLYISAATVQGVRQPVLIVATANNTVYAFSPGNPSAPPFGIRSWEPGSKV